MKLSKEKPGGAEFHNLVVYPVGKMDLFWTFYYIDIETPKHMTTRLPFSSLYSFSEFPTSKASELAHSKSILAEKFNITSLCIIMFQSQGRMFHKKTLNDDPKGQGKADQNRMLKRWRSPQG